MIIYNPEIVSRWIVVLVFIVGGVLNTIGIKPIREEFARWGLKPWMRVATGLSELVIATLLIKDIFVIPSLIAATLIMLSAVIILGYHKDRNRLWLPTVVLPFILLSLSFQI